MLLLRAAAALFPIICYHGDAGTIKDTQTCGLFVKQTEKNTIYVITMDDNDAMDTT